MCIVRKHTCKFTIRTNWLYIDILKTTPFANKTVVLVYAIHHNN